MSETTQTACRTFYLPQQTGIREILMPLVLIITSFAIQMFGCGSDEDDDTGDTSEIPGDDDSMAMTSPPGDDDSSQNSLTSPYAKPIYVRGTFNNWTGDAAVLEPYQLIPTHENLMYVEATIPYGNQKFKIADDSWSVGTNFGNPAGANDVITLGQPKVLGDNGFDLFLTLDTSGIYSFSLDTTVPLSPIVTVHLIEAITGTCAPDMNKSRAYWVETNSIVWRTEEAAAYRLYYAPAGGMSLENGQITGGSFIEMLPVATLDEQHPLYASYPYLKGQQVFDVSEIAEQASELLSGQVIVASVKDDASICDATGVQTFGVIDALYAYEGSDLGATFSDDGKPTLKLWAPTAKDVHARIYEDSTSDTYVDVSLARNEHGIWSYSGDEIEINRYYVYRVQVYIPESGQIEENVVTDPYSFSLSQNGLRSQIVNLKENSLKPDGWDALIKPSLNAFEDIALYELHVRDFSANDASCAASHRGKFTAFSQMESQGMSHLERLAEAGLTHIHLLPSFDIATIEEDISLRQEPDVPEDAAPDSEAQQSAVSATRDQDAYNWGYDPYHYFVPEGSYSTNPDGAGRTVEFRSMVKSLNDIGLRAVMDVVFNHTHAAGQDAMSVLDRIVPGYFYRLDENGYIQSSTCCPDTASEHIMMEKLIIDAIRMWSVEYKVDGFRFDLMGHHTKTNMQHIREMLDQLTVEKDGVDGRQIYLYGEAWRFGSLQAILPDEAFYQANTYGYGIGSFNDRIRDSIRGGSPFSSLWEQGFVTGIFYDDNFIGQGDLETVEYLESQRTALLNLMDNIRLGMAGNLRDFSFINGEGDLVTGAEIVYRGSTGAGYTADPQEIINYVDVHDNQTLFDYIQAKAPFNTADREPETATVDDRIRMQNLGISVVALAQGVPFFQAGVELLRSKSGDKDSYNSGDWFNRLDFSYQTNNWGVGLPPAEKNENDWEFWGERLADPAIAVEAIALQTTLEHFLEMLSIRRSSVLFRLQTADEIMARVTFPGTEAGPEQLPGVIMMEIADRSEQGDDLDPEIERVLILINATGAGIDVSHDSLLGNLVLHPLQQSSADPILASSECGDGEGVVTVPARTAMVCLELL